MNPLALGLVTFSAVTHALWNLISKRSRPAPVYFLVTTVSGCVLVSPALVVWRALPATFPPAVWVLLVATGFFQAVYYVGLSLAYRRSDLSFAYPVARALPVAVVPLVSRALGNGGLVSALAAAGMALIAAGVLFMPLSGKGSPRGQGGGAVLLPALAAAGTVGYSLIDDAALRILRSGALDSSSPIPHTLVYAFFETLSAALWLVPAALGMAASERRAGRPAPRPAWSAAVISGCLITGAYVLVLLAMGYSTNVSYVVAFRQLGVPIGAVLGILVLGERPGPLRWIGLGGICAGLALVAVG